MGDISLKKQSYLTSLNQVVEALIERGHNPYGQLKGYFLMENIAYITSHNDARSSIKAVDREFIEEYLKNWELYQDKERKITFLKLLKK